MGGVVIRDRIAVSTNRTCNSQVITLRVMPFHHDCRWGGLGLNQLFAEVFLGACGNYTTAPDCVLPASVLPNNESLASTGFTAERSRTGTRPIAVSAPQ